MRHTGILDALRGLKSKELSLDAPVPSLEGEDSTLGDTVRDEGPSVFDHVEHAEQRAAIIAALETLPLRERLIVAARFGLDGCEPATLPDIGAVFGVSKQRACQIETQALQRMAASLIPALGLSVDSIAPTHARARRKR